MELEILICIFCQVSLANSTYKAIRKIFFSLFLSFLFVRFYLSIIVMKSILFLSEVYFVLFLVFIYLLKCVARWEMPSSMAAKDIAIE